MEIANQFVEQVYRYDQYVQQLAREQIDDTPELERYRNLILRHPEIAEAIASWQPENPAAALARLKRLWLTWYKRDYLDLYETIWRLRIYKN